MPSPESTLMRRISRAASNAGARVFRNNVGVARYLTKAALKRMCPHCRGLWDRAPKVQYGLCKGSSDIIGWTPHVITQDDVGRTVALFTAIEVKMPTGRLSKAQKNFLDQVNAVGGRALVARHVEDVL